MTVQARLPSLLAVMFLAAILLVPSAPSRAAADVGPAALPPYVEHAPIWIAGDLGFTTESGVTGGTGTPADPYVIEGWRINSSSDGVMYGGGHGVYIQDTQMAVVVRDLQVYNDACTQNLSWCGSGGIEVYNASNVLVESVEVSGVWVGISLAGVMDGRVDNATVVTASLGISAGSLHDAGEIYDSRNITFDGNRVLNRADRVLGISICANDSVVQDNAVLGAYEPYSVCVSNNVTVSHNLASGGAYSGIDVHYSTNVLVDSNDFVGLGSGSLAVLAYQSSAVTLTGNVFRGTGTMNVDLSGGEGNVLYHNAFEADAIDAYQSGLNAWDHGYPSGGNYWSDYSGVDLCSGPSQSICTGPDGIGDTPRSISPSGDDRYPLMQPYAPPNFVPVAFFTTSAYVLNSTTPLVVNGSASADPQDPSGALEVRWDWEGDGTWDTPWATEKTTTHTYPVAGVYRIRMAVRDTSGLESNTSHRVLVDNVPPTTSATVVGDLGTGGWYRSAVTVFLHGTDDSSGVASIRYRVDGGPWSSWAVLVGSATSVFPLVVNEGVHLIEYYSVDAAGNSGIPQALTIRSDLSVPVLSALAPGSIVTASRVGVNWTGLDSVSGIAGYAVSVDGRPFLGVGNATETVLILADGSHTVVVRATDVAGNNGTATTRFRVDTNPFSFSGPFAGLPTVLVVVTLVASVVAVLMLRMRSRKSPPGNP